MIRHQGSQWILYTHDGSRVLGRHPSRERALAQERAIEASKARRARGNPRKVHGICRLKNGRFAKKSRCRRRR